MIESSFEEILNHKEKKGHMETAPRVQVALLERSVASHVEKKWTHPESPSFRISFFLNPGDFGIRPGIDRSFCSNLKLSSLLVFISGISKILGMFRNLGSLMRAWNVSNPNFPSPIPAWRSLREPSPVRESFT